MNSNNKLIKLMINKQINIKLINTNIENKNNKNIIESINIPKILHLCYKNKNIPDYIIPNWQKLNPDYKIYFYDDNDCINFLKENYDQLYADIFNFIKDGPIKADFFRVCVLYKIGGIYCDIDIEPLVPFDDFKEKDISFLTCLSSVKNDYNPHIIMCSKNNILIKSCINTYIDYYNQKKPYSYWGWSIVYVMKKNTYKIFNRFFNDECVTVDEKYNKYQFIKEMGKYPDIKSFYCTYNGRKLLNNRYNSYNYETHTF